MTDRTIQLTCLLLGCALLGWTLSAAALPPTDDARRAQVTHG